MAEVLAIQHQQIEEYGGAHGVRDKGLLETAINGRADALVTFNLRDFGSIPERFGIEVMIPREALRRIR